MLIMSKVTLLKLKRMIRPLYDLLIFSEIVIKRSVPNRGNNFNLFITVNYIDNKSYSLFLTFVYF